MINVPVLKSVNAISLTIVLAWMVQRNSAINFDHLLAAFFISSILILLFSFAKQSLIGPNELWVGSFLLFMALSMYVFATSPRTDATLFIENQSIALFSVMVFSILFNLKKKIKRIQYPAFLATKTQLIVDNLIIGTSSLLLVKVVSVLIDFPS